mmetsp:Transcript_23094/g.54748  ORF Transcript_23094/g.54748 Transcript_23094/m.54748 type:complete len:190 (+) Transcript_23094:849-1418(+)
MNLIFSPEEEKSVFFYKKPSEKLFGLEKSKQTRDYSYGDLLNRLIENLKKSGLESEKKERLVIPPPKISKDGTKKTLFMNFMETCQKLNREKEHLLLYISSELGAFASVQNGGGLVLKGRFQPKGIENILRNYIREYVLCGSCRSAETILKKDSLTRLFFLLCERCKASRSVNPIRQGYIAQVKRKKVY